MSRPVSPVVANGTYIFSLYVKPAGFNWIMLEMHDLPHSDDFIVFFNVATGAVGATEGTIGVTPTIEAAANGFYRCSFGINVGTDPEGPNETAFIHIHLTDKDVDSSFQGDDVSGVYVWGGQYELTPLSPYKPVLGAQLPAATHSATASFGMGVSEGRRNLLTYTEAFDNSVWEKYEATCTANYADAPDGTTTAERLVASTNNDEHTFGQRPTLLPSTVYTYSVYVQADSQWEVELYVLRLNGSPAGAYFQLYDIAISGAFNLLDSGIQDLGTGWVRCWITFNSNTGAVSPIAVVAPADGSDDEIFAGDGVGGLYVWGAQLDLGAITAYEPVLATRSVQDAYSALTVLGAAVAEGSATATDTLSSSANVWRPAVAEGSATAADTPSVAASTYSAAVAEGSATAADTLSTTGSVFNPIVAEGRYNLLSYTEEFDNARWTPNASSVTANAGTDPLGGSTADKFIPDSTFSASHYVTQLPHEYPPLNFVLNGSVYVKPAGHTFFFIGITGRNGTTSFSSFDLTTLTTSFGATIEPLPNGWFRCFISTSVGSSGTNNQAGRLNLMSAPTSSAFYTGNSVDGVLLWGAQLTPSPLVNYLAVSARYEGDTPSAATTASAAVAEGGSTGADTTDGSVSVLRVGRVGWIRLFAEAVSGVFSDSVAEGTATATDTQTAGLLLSASVAEGTATATDTPSAVGTYAATAAEGSATAVDTPNAGRTTAASVAEGTPTATDTPSATAVEVASVAEGSATAVDTPSNTAVFRPSVAEGSATAVDTPSAAYVTSASVAEGTATAVDAPSAKATFAGVIAEGSATSFDTPSANSAIAASLSEGSPTASDTVTADLNTVLSGAVAEGTATAADTPSATGVYPANVAEVSTGLDTPSAAFSAGASVVEGSATSFDSTFGTITQAASVAEGTATAVDTPSTSGGVQAGTVPEGTATAADTVTAALVQNATVLEGSVTAVDTPNRTLTLAAILAEGSPTAVDTCTTSVVFSGSIAEGTATAQDTANAFAVWKAVTVNEVSTAQDTQDFSGSASADTIEGSATAQDTPNALRYVDASIHEGSDTAFDTSSAVATYGGYVFEGSDTAFDLVIGYTNEDAFVFEISVAADTVNAELLDRSAARDRVYAFVDIDYFFAEPYSYVAIFTPLDDGLAVFTEPPPKDFIFTEPKVEAKFTDSPVFDPKYDSPEKRLVKV
jgi:hypothetical protein